MAGVEISNSDLQDLLRAIFVCAIAATVALWWLSHKGLRVGSWFVHVAEEDAPRLAFAIVAVVFADAAGTSLLLAKTGGFVAGDFRTSPWFLAINVLIILVVAPSIAVAAFVSLWRRHHRKE